MKSSWIHGLLILLIIEKIVQHIFVTLAFYFNWGNIAATVAVLPTVLMVAGAIVTVLFIVDLGGMFKKQTWALALLIFLALFDLLGEFAAQGKIAIQINVSFLVAATILTFALVYRRQLT